MAWLTLFVIIGLLLIFLEFFLPGTIMAVAGGVILILSVGFFAWIYPVGWKVTLFAILLAICVVLVCRVALRQIKRK
jgi:membrane protein implicated in regulation of membrane protease activity